MRVSVLPLTTARLVQHNIAQASEAEVEEPNAEQLQRMLHDLSNLLTGILVTAGLLQLALQGDRRQHYAVEICAGSERGATLVREARALLTDPEDQLSEVAEQIDPATRDLFRLRAED